MNEKKSSEKYVRNGAKIGGRSHTKSNERLNFGLHTQRPKRMAAKSKTEHEITHERDSKLKKPKKNKSELMLKLQDEWKKSKRKIRTK